MMVIVNICIYINTVYNSNTYIYNINNNDNININNNNDDVSDNMYLS